MRNVSSGRPFVVARWVIIDEVQENIGDVSHVNWILQWLSNR